MAYWLIQHQLSAYKIVTSLIYQKLQIDHLMNTKIIDDLYTNVIEFFNVKQNKLKPGFAP